MEKILLVINARKPHLGSVDFACSIAKMAKTRLTGLVIENAYLQGKTHEVDDDYFSQPQVTSNVIADTDQTVRIFKEVCQRNGVKNEVFTESGEPIEKVIFESRFADLVIIDPAINFYNREESVPSYVIREILSKTECPVLLAPLEYDGFDEIVFCYDGSASSVFAIKQFTYLFPELSESKVQLLEITTDQDELEENDSHMRAWMKAHYRSTTFISLNGDPRDELFNFFFMRQRMFVVIGAYGRSLLSQLFRKSQADLLIRNVDLPIFIAHH